jgi:hypothetical protein
MGRGLLLCTSLVSLLAPSAAASSDPPRVALLFITAGKMPLESVWETFLEGVRGLVPPPLSPQQFSEVMEDDRIENATARLQQAGRFTANDIVSKQYCVDDELIMVRVRALDRAFWTAAQWRGAASQMVDCPPKAAIISPIMFLFVRPAPLDERVVPREGLTAGVR